MVGEIGQGFCLLVGFTHGDTAAQVDWMAEKVAGLRLFTDADGKMNLGLDEVGGALLVISQFTLYGDAAKGPGLRSSTRPGRRRPFRFTSDSWSSFGGGDLPWPRESSAPTCRWPFTTTDR